MKATEILKSEHEVIEGVITSIETVTRAARNGAKVNPDFYSQSADFIRGFADGCHHRKEENVLFKALEATGSPAQAGPVRVMLSEHDEGRALTQAMRQGAARWKEGDLAGKEQALEAADEYAALLRQHIFKENNILFPLADRIIPADRQEKVAEDFERVEHEETGEGIHENYLGLAKKLEAQAGEFAS